MERYILNRKGMNFVLGIPCNFGHSFPHSEILEKQPAQPHFDLVSGSTWYPKHVDMIRSVVWLECLDTLDKTMNYKGMIAL